MPSDAATLPQRPHLKPWYRTATDDAGVVLEHGGRIVAFDGPGAAQLLPRLLPLLDGTRSVDEIVASVGRQVEPAVRRALALLAEQGLLLDGPSSGDDITAASDRFLSWLSGSDAPTSLAGRASGVALVAGNGRLAEPLARAIAHGGLDVVRAEPSVRGGDVVVATPATDELELVSEWNAALLAAPRPLLPVRPFDGRVAGVGPFVLPNETCCWECFRIRLAANLPDPDAAARAETVPAPAFSFPPLDELVAAVAALVVLRWVLRSDPRLPGTYWTIAVAPRLAIAEHRVYRVPRCSACSALARRAQPLPWFKEEPRAA